jgi:hypothetical protein
MYSTSFLKICRAHFSFFQEVQKSWFKKAADEADLVITSESEDEGYANSAERSAKAKAAIQVLILLRELQRHRCENLQRHG